MKDESWSEETDVEEIRVIARWAHDAAIICYDGTSRTPLVAARYENVDGVK